LVAEQQAFEVTSRNRLLRLAKRAEYDRQAIYDIVDAALICHVAYVIDGQPYVIPTLHARDGDTLLLHGHGTSRTLEHAGAGNPVCVGITHTDGIVLARSMFNHSINYRSVAIYGNGRAITDSGEKTDALYRFSEKIVPGRWNDVRPMSEQELKATAVVAIDIEQASAKIRTGEPKDEPEDLGFPAWAGVIPIAEVYGTPAPEQHVPADSPVPPYISELIARRS
jgi:nitroimidazol reductase NimA-like FMN-containing flavoprotein (pyridoxamine 5'-phosphate oxidase superfamily)